jgi:hypothetical protein
MQKVKVKIKGVTPLLFNKPPEYEHDSKIKVNNPNINEDDGLKNKLYSQGGKIYTPATHIRGALINAGKDLKVKGKGKATYSKMFASMVMISPEALVHKSPKLDVLTVRTVNPNTRGQNMTKRPRLRDWELVFNCEVEDEIPLEVLHEALQRAGRYVGIGDWRPATKGVHGKFMVTEFSNGKKQ